MLSSARISLWNRARRCPVSQVKGLYNSQLALFDKPVAEAPILAVDLEMTGLNPASDHLLSIGWVPIGGNKVIVEEANHLYIHSNRAVGDSATIHGITDSARLQGLSPKRVMEQFLQAAAGKMLLFHHAQLDLAFINKVFQVGFGCGFKPAVIDTMQLQKKILLRRSDAIAQGALRLPACRTFYNLPHYSGHNALVDALATAELFLAITSNRRREKLYRLIS